MAEYNINAVTRRVVFTGSAGLGPYAFTFEILDEDDIVVYFNSTKLTKTTDYTVSINANGTGSVSVIVNVGGNIPETPDANDTIIVAGARDIERVTDFVTAGALLASSLNEQLDSLTIFDQQVAEENKRAMRAPIYDPALVEDGGIVDMTLPAKADRASKYLAFDSDGNPTALAGTADPLDTVDTAQLVSSAVTTAKIADGAVTTAKIANDAVTQAKIADDAVGQAQIADDAVGSDQIADDAVALGTQTTGNYVADITAGNAITTSGGGSENATVTVNHADTSSQASVNNSGNTVIQDVTLDTYGHVTGLTSKTISTTTLPVSYYAIGDYTMAVVFSNTSVSTAAGSTRAGSDLQSVHFTANDGDVGSSFETAAVRRVGGITSGTWRNNSSGTVGGESIVIWVRTA